MEKSDYLRLEATMRQEIENHKARLKADLESKKQQDLDKINFNEVHQRQNARLAEKQFGRGERVQGSIEDVRHQNQSKQDMLYSEKYEKEIEGIGKKYEKFHFGEFGGKLKAREAAFGPNNPEVLKEKEQLKARQEMQQKLQQAREQQEKTKEKGNMSQVFNRSAKQQQLEKSVQEKKAEGISKDFNKAADNQRMHQQNKEIKR